MTSTPPEPDQAAAAPVLLPTSVRVSIVGTFVILLCGALFYARSFFLPVVLALLIALTFLPLVRTLAQRGIPAPVTAILLVVALGLGLFAASTFLSDPVVQMVQAAPDVVRQVREQFSFLRQPFEMLNDAIREMQAIAGGAEGAENADRVVVAPSGPSGLVGWLAGTVAGIGTTLGATLILVFFLLTSSESLRVKIVHMSPKLSDKKRALRVLRDVENDVSRYLFTITLINAAFGASVGLAVYALGLPNALLWGVAAGLLNFVPYVGGLVGTLLMVAVSLISFPTLALAALPPIAYLTLQFVESTFVTPIILGRRLEIHIVAIVVFLALTTWMWGIVGTLIGVPLLVVIKVFTDNFPGLATISALLAAEHAPVEENGDAAAVADKGNKAEIAGV